MNRMSNRRSLVAVSLLSLSTLAQAQFVVVDPANLIENTLQEIDAITQIANQVKSLAHEVTMLENEARNLEHLDFNSLQRLRALFATTERLLAQAQGLSLDLEAATEQFAKSYPDTYTAASREQMREDQGTHWINAHEALRTALQVQAQSRQNFADDTSVLSDLIAKSQAADGALQAAQSTNQLLALQSRQLIQGQELAITHERSVDLEQARAIEAQQRAIRQRQLFMTDDAHYTASPVVAFPQGGTP